MIRHLHDFPNENISSSVRLSGRLWVAPLIIKSSVLFPLLFPSNPLVCPINERGRARTKLSIPTDLVKVQPTPLENVAMIVSWSCLVSSASVSPSLTLYVPLTCERYPVMFSSESSVLYTTNSPFVIPTYGKFMYMYIQTTQILITYLKADFFWYSKGISRELSSRVASRLIHRRGPSLQYKLCCIRCWLQ